MVAVPSWALNVAVALAFEEELTMVCELRSNQCDSSAKRCSTAADWGKANSAGRLGNCSRDRFDNRRIYLDDLSRLIHIAAVRTAARSSPMNGLGATNSADGALVYGHLGSISTPNRRLGQPSVNMYYIT